MPRMARHRLAGALAAALAVSLAVAAASAAAAAAPAPGDRPQVRAPRPPRATSTHPDHVRGAAGRGQLLPSSPFLLPSSLAPFLQNATTATLLYIPVHTSESEAHLDALIECALAPRVAPSTVGAAFDLLLVVSGGDAAAAAAAAARGGAKLRAAAARLPEPRPRVRAKAAPGGGAYDRAAAGVSADWVKGPNEAFYSVMIGGGEGKDGLHERIVSRYHFVQQLETDVCAGRPGWLDALLNAAAASPRALVVGARLAGDCVWIAADRTCRHLGPGDAALARHINGNALFRASPDLASLLGAARSLFGNAEPFDLALWQTAAALGAEDRLVATPLAVNCGALVDAARFAAAAYHGRADIALVHAPRRLRADAVTAASARAPVEGPATLVAVASGDAEAGLLRHALHSLAAARVADPLFVAPDDGVAADVVKLAPYRTLVAPAAPAAAAALAVRGVDVLLVSTRFGALGDYSTALQRAMHASSSSRYDAWVGVVEPGREGAPPACAAVALDPFPPPLFIPARPPAAALAVADWAAAPHASIPLAPFLRARGVACRRLPRALADARDAFARWDGAGDPVLLVSAAGEASPAAAVRALTVAGAWRGAAADAARAWGRRGGGAVAWRRRKRERERGRGGVAGVV